MRMESTFQFTPVVRRATSKTKVFSWWSMFQFTPVVRRATHFHSPAHVPKTVSIHARRATGDLKSRLIAVEGRFQFTPVVRRATVRCRRTALVVARFNSRPSCDGRLRPIFRRMRPVLFQFTPVVRRATDLTGGIIYNGVFQFTPVVRRATTGASCAAVAIGFNSRPSCDGRPSINIVFSWCWMFQFTPVVRRATLRHRRARRIKLVSIHARRATGDKSCAS